MADGPGKYDAACTMARTLTDAEAVVLVVLNGVRGSGFSVQSHETVPPPVLADMLETHRQSTANEDRSMTTTAPNLPQGPTSLGTDDPALCRKCGGKMLRGHALRNTLTGRVTISRTGRAEIVPCLKCIQCGYSVTVDPMSDAREIVSLEIAAGMLCVRPGGQVHTFRQAGSTLIGADWDRDALLEAMRKAPCIDISGEKAQAFGHGLCIVDEHGPLFIETQKEHAEPLSVWTLFDSPADAPGQYVLRRFESHPVEPRPTSDVLTSDNIEELREIVRGMGLYCLGRLEADEPQIVESWI